MSAEFDARIDKHILRISRTQHGNIKSSVINADFVHGADHEVLATAGRTFKGLLGAEAVIKKGEGDKAKESKVGDFRAAMDWLMQQAENSVGRQRYKGLGEMNPSQLWETTMDPTVRRLLRVQIDDAIEADRVFTMLMGDEVEPRRDFIESNALRAATSTSEVPRRPCRRRGGGLCVTLRAGAKFDPFDQVQRGRDEARSLAGAGAGGAARESAAELRELRPDARNGARARRRVSACTARRCRSSRKRKKHWEYALLSQSAYAQLTKDKAAARASRRRVAGAHARTARATQRPVPT